MYVKFILLLFLVIIIYIYLLKPRLFKIDSPLFKIDSPLFNVTIVIARYNENIEWTKLLPNTIIYNKGKELDSSVSSYNLTNVGREGHTYYHHIVTNYDNLPDAILFLQGNPFDHSPNLFNNIKKIFNKNKPYSFVYLSEHFDTNGLDGSWWHYNLHSYVNKLPNIPKDLPKKVYRKLFNKYPPNNIIIKYGKGAQFMASKKTILKHPKSFYIKICKLLDHNVNPAEGFIIERFHPLIFTNH
jgi:hypothetical protein